MKGFADEGFDHSQDKLHSKLGRRILEMEDSIKVFGMTFGMKRRSGERLGMKGSKSFKDFGS